MTRVVGSAIGGLLVLVALLGALLGGWLLSVFGTEGKYEVPVAEVSVPGAALYVNLFDVDPASYLPDGLLDTYVVASNPGPEDLFIGVGAANDVQDLLLGVPYDAASDLASGAFVLRSVPGSRIPAPAPQDSTLWQVSAAGNPAILSWNEQDGSGVFVVMNADGSAGVTAELTATLESPRVVPLMAVLLVVSLLVGLLGAAILASVSRSTR